MNPNEINAIDSEAGVIASIIRRPELCFHSEQLQPCHFSNKDNAIVYTAISNLVQQKIYTIDAFNIIEVLNSNDTTRKFAEDISIEKIDELIEMSGVLARRTEEEYEMLVSNVLDAAFRRDLFLQLQSCQTMCFNGNMSTEALQQESYRMIDDVMMSYASNNNDTPMMAEIIDEMWSEIESRQASGYSGTPFKFNALNEYVTIEKGELVIFCADAKGGKSMMLLNCAVDLLKKGKSVLYIDSELNTRMFTARLISHLSGIRYKSLTSGRYTYEEDERRKEAIEWIYVA